MDLFTAIILGLVEGLTEYLPVSSTGHLILVSRWLGQTGEAAKAFDIVIQLGAILAVVVHYRALLSARLRSMVAREPGSMQLFLALLLGFLPAAIVGLMFASWIKRLLFGPLPVALALAVGGVLMLVVERRVARHQNEVSDDLDAVTPKRAFLIGLGQCFSLWPGASRSMCTIVTAQLCGLSTRTAAEFSFLLALPTLGAATVYEAFKSRHELEQGIGATSLAVGLVVSFLVAWAVIATFVRYLGKHGLAPFAYYRIALAAVVFWLAS
ncbi:MAG: undecaprenyl-diphosphate phosphatase [Polyangiaceae bacterium]|nr:undecaprenyl-diphosphate phosphatase [Polyangiaceae bacterium]